MTTPPAHTASPARFEPLPTAHVGGAGEAVEIDAGGDLDASPPPPLSVAQLLHALRLVRRQPPPAADGVGEPARSDIDCTIHCDIAVVSAHPAAGASTLALAVADALAATGRPVALLDYAVPGRSALSAATDTELGTLPTGDWLVGRRAALTVYRRAVTVDAAPGRDWGVLPPPPVVRGDTSVVADLSGLDPARCPQPDAHSTVLLVCRPTVPGLAQAEAWLTTFAASRSTVLVAAVGPRRWPKPAAASVGPRLARLRAERRVITVPLQPRLAITGVSADPLPAALLAAAARAIQLLPDAGVRPPGRDIADDPTDDRAGEPVDGFALVPVAALEPVR